MDKPLPFEMDDHGNVITKPILGWASVTVGEIAILLAIQYADTPEEVETGHGKQIQFLLTSQQSLGLADLLTKQVNRLTEPPPLGTILH